MCQKRGFWATTRASVFWTSCKRAKFDTDVPARSIIILFITSRGNSCALWLVSAAYWTQQISIKLTILFFSVQVSCVHWTWHSCVHGCRKKRWSVTWWRPGRQWRTEGGAEGAIRPGRHFERGGKKEKKEKKKKKEKKNGKKEKGRKRKKNMEEACNYSKTKMEHLSCGALCTHKLASWRPWPFWHKRVVRIYVLLHKALKCIGS